VDRTSGHSDRLSAGNRSSNSLSRIVIALSSSSRKIHIDPWRWFSNQLEYGSGVAADRADYARLDGLIRRTA
jgi:hypothetical protein